MVVLCYKHKIINLLPACSAARYGWLEVGDGSKSQEEINDLMLIIHYHQGSMSRASRQYKQEESEQAIIFISVKSWL
jgi:hypothetical protein